MFLIGRGGAAGGGFPQWICNCANCQGLRNGSLQATPRT
ncbi:pyrroloquinoline quinone biosynthesis protein PqqB, partial [Enterobacter intestinihominis]